MQIRFKKMNCWKTQNLYEWQPQGSAKWYPIHRKNIVVIHERSPQALALERSLFNQALQGQTLTLKATYFNHTYTKTLVVEGLEND